MFENLIDQEAGLRLIQDIKQKKLPPSILFSGPECSGKLTAALSLPVPFLVPNRDSGHVPVLHA